MSGWAVILVGHYRTYGPFDNREEADMFAAFLTTEVDPAVVQQMHSPARELMAWRASTRPTQEHR